MPVLTAEDVTAGYSRVPIIHDVSLTAEAGTITAILGPNGAGKSTFAKALCGVLKPMSGRIWVGETETTNLPGHMIPRHGLGYVPQNDNVFKRMSVRENLEVAGFVRRKRDDGKIDEVLAIFPDLQKAEHKQAGQLSGGQQNMLAMARSLMIDPVAVILDEPTAGLSPAYTAVVWEQIQRIAASGTAAIVVEQNVDQALQHAHTVYVLIAGTNHVHGPTAEIAGLDLGAIFLGHTQTSATSSTP
ncbi:MAG TPA: ABC transporter ATP-binding protein [Solirubrobacteraceae bacterium]|nr:ABC transporter ATP-binding protein [Solirubrobacteraceae bacterium]